MTKKIFGLFAAAGAAVTLSSCGFDGLTVLTWKTDQAEGVLRQLGDDFEKEYGIEVKFEAYTNYETDVKKRLSTGDYGDVLAVPNINANEIPTFFEPLGTVEDLDSTYRNITKNAVDGTVYGIPSAINVEGILINKKVWADAGWNIDTPNTGGIQNGKKYPTTHEEFLDVMAGIEADGATPYYTNYASGWAPGQWTNNVSIYVDGPLEEAQDYMEIGAVADATPFTDGAPLYDLFELLYDIVANGYNELDHTTTDWDSSKQYMADGTVGTMVLGGWSIGQVQMLEPEGQDNIAYIPFPKLDEDGGHRAIMAGDYGLGVNINTNDKDASYGKDGDKTKKELSKELVKYMVAYDPYIEENMQIPTLKSSDIPDFYVDFMSQVTLVEMSAKPADIPTSRSDIETEAGFMFWSDNYKLEIIDEANKIKNGQSSGKSYAQIMSGLQSTWTSARNKELDSSFNTWYAAFATGRGYGAA